MGKCNTQRVPEHRATHVKATIPQGILRFSLDENGLRLGNGYSPTINYALCDRSAFAAFPLTNNSTDEEITAWIAGGYGFRKTKPRTHNLKQVCAMEQLHVPGIIKIRPYIYSNLRDMTNPAAKVVIKADVWACEGVGKQSFHNRSPIVAAFHARCDVDAEKGTISKDGVVLDAPNMAVVLQTIGDAINAWRGSQKS